MIETVYVAIRGGLCRPWIDYDTIAHSEATVKLKIGDRPWFSRRYPVLAIVKATVNAEYEVKQ